MNGKLATSIVNWDGPLARDVPAHLLPGLRRYVDHGVIPGDFLQAVLADDMVAAVARADDKSFAGLRPLSLFLWNELPTACWGNREKIARWAERIRAERADEGEAEPANAEGTA